MCMGMECVEKLGYAKNVASSGGVHKAVNENHIKRGKA